METAMQTGNSVPTPGQPFELLKYLTFVIGPPDKAPQGGASYRPDIEQKEVFGPVMHPGKNDGVAYRPGNEFASEYTALKVLWENFGLLLNRARDDADGLSRKLMMKAAVVELRSFMDALPRYGRLVAGLPGHDGRLPRSILCLTGVERAEFDAARRKFKSAREAVLGLLNKVRNNVAAHMSQPLLVGMAPPPRGEALPWHEIEELWNALEPEMLADLVLAGDDLMDCIRLLPLHEFFRFEGDYRLRLHVPLVAEIVGDALHLNGLSDSLIKQIEGVDASASSVRKIVLPLAVLLRR